jgi:hypothetical protein
MDIHLPTLMRSYLRLKPDRVITGVRQMCAGFVLLGATVAVSGQSISVDLSLGSLNISVGQSTAARSTAWPAGSIVSHGLEGRLLPNGTWQNWGVWNDSGGTQQAAWPAPSSVGTYELRAYAAGSDGVSTYSISSTLIVTAVPLTCTLSLDSNNVTLGQGTTARSTAGPSGQVIYHGLEGRLQPNGTWQNWGVWNDSGGTQQTAGIGPSIAGTYEVRAYVARADQVATYSASSTLTVTAVPITVTLTFDNQNLAAGQTTTARSTAGPAGQIVDHGLEARLLPSGTWQNWGVWNDSGGTQKTALLGPFTAGAYEVRAYAARADHVSTNSTLVVVTTTQAPAITTQPVGQHVALGASVTFTVAANGYPPPSYQWRKGGASISGATTANYTLSNVMQANAGTYDVVVTNSSGSVTSAGAELAVTAVYSDGSTYYIQGVDYPSNPTKVTENHPELNIQAGPAVVVHTGANVDYVVSSPKSIRLEAGFHAEAGSRFHAYFGSYTPPPVPPPDPPSTDPTSKEPLLDNDKDGIPDAVEASLGTNSNSTNTIESGNASGLKVYKPK